MHVAEKFQHALERLKQLQSLTEQLEQHQAQQQHAQVLAVDAEMEAVQDDIMDRPSGIPTTHSPDAECTLVVEQLKVDTDYGWSAHSHSVYQHMYMEVTLSMPG